MKKLCPVCGNTMTHGNRNGVDLGYLCLYKRCSKRRYRIEAKAREDERRIAREEADLEAYTAALIDLQAKRARDELR